jgi:CDP-diacylglycerol--serine O-phosphatidyltransferase
MGVRPRSTANGLTLACLSFGFLAVLAAGRGEGSQALICLALGGLVDTLAGRVAHGWKLESELGAELDSLASLVLWGVATGLLAYSAALSKLGGFGTLLACLYAAAAAWRLCKGDVQTGRPEHLGLPLPAAGALLSAAVAFDASAGLVAALVLGLSAAMLLPLRYPRPAVPLPALALLLVSLGAAALGWRWGWALPGIAAGAWGLGAPFYFRLQRSLAQA